MIYILFFTILFSTVPSLYAGRGDAFWRNRWKLNIWKKDVNKEKKLKEERERQKKEKQEGSGKANLTPSENV